MNINTNMKLETWEKILIPSSVQSLGRVRLFATPWTAACEASLSITNSWSLLKLVHQVGDAIQPSHPLLSPSPLLLRDGETAHRCHFIYMEP